jgi:hypothetical protein
MDTDETVGTDGQLSETELAAERAEALPDREVMSLLMTQPGLGLVDAGATSTPATDSTAAGPSPDGGAADQWSGYAHDTASDELADAPPPDQGGTYSPTATSTASS